MAEPDNSLILEHLRAIRGDLAAIRGDVAEIKVRLTNVEGTIATMQQALGHYAATQAQMQASIDRQGVRLDRIDARLGIFDDVRKSPPRLDF